MITIILSLIILITMFIIGLGLGYLYGEWYWREVIPTMFSKPEHFEKMAEELDEVMRWEESW